jgi:DNA recombination protein RmuC
VLVERLKESLEQNFSSVSNQLSHRLTEDWNKTNNTFNDLTNRLVKIDHAQEKITELSSNVLNLQKILQDKRCRGAFGEVQLKQLVENILPKNSYEFQYTLSNHTRCDCIIFFPAPNNNIVVDSKFPLENFQKLFDPNLDEQKFNEYRRSCTQDIKHHIQTIATKYIICNETSDTAIMFIPAESIFAEIHNNFPELVDFSYKKKVWLASPTTLMAILTTSNSVLKQSEASKHIKLIHQQINLLAKDFSRFEQRVDSTVKYINKTAEELVDLQTSAKKITNKFSKIEQIDLECEKTI